MRGKVGRRREVAIRLLTGGLLVVRGAALTQFEDFCLDILACGQRGMFVAKIQVTRIGSRTGDLHIVLRFEYSQPYYYVFRGCVVATVGPLAHRWDVQGRRHRYYLYIARKSCDWVRKEYMWSGAVKSNKISQAHITVM